MLLEGVMVATLDTFYWLVILSSNILVLLWSMNVCFSSAMSSLPHQRQRGSLTTRVMTNKVAVILIPYCFSRNFCCLKKVVPKSGKKLLAGNVYEYRIQSVWVTNRIFLIDFLKKMLGFDKMLHQVCALLCHWAVPWVNFHRLFQSRCPLIGG